MSNFEYQPKEFSDSITSSQRRLAKEIKDEDPRFKRIDKDQWEKLDAIFWNFRRQMPWHSAACMGMKRILTHNPEVKTACVGWINGQICLAINAQWFLQQTAQAQMFVLAHEVEHVVREHLKTILNWPDLQTKLNFTMDALINSALVENFDIFTWDNAPKEIISFDVFVDTVKNRQPYDPKLRGKSFPSEGEDVKEFLHNFTAEELLKYLPKEQERPQSKQKGKGGNQSNEPWSIEDLMGELGSEFFDDGTTPDQLKDSITESIIDEAEKVAGSTPGYLQKYVNEVKDKTNRDWRKALRGVGNSTRTDVKRSWGHINKRMPWRKSGRYIFTRPSVCLVIDRSGSVGTEETKEFMKECNGLTDWCDLDMIYVDAAWDPDNPETFKKGVKSIEEVWKGWVDIGGGTDFNDVYDYLLGPGAGKYESVILLTDGYLWGDPMLPGPLAKYNVAILTPDHSDEFAAQAKKFGYDVVVIDDSRRNRRRKMGF